jgi:RND family efflux transporter MFP subunit
MHAKPWLFSIAACLALGLAAGCGRENPPAAPTPRVVRAQPVYLSGGDRVRTFAGVARAGMETQLSFKVSGTISRLDVQVGDQLRAGARVASLESTDFELQAENARANLLRQQAAARSAATTYARTVALYENNNASLAELEAARANDESAQAAVQSAQKSLELAQTQLSYTTLVAPVAGAISAVAVEEGENVAAGSPVAMLTAGSHIEVEATIPEMLIASVVAGQKVAAVFDAVGGREFSATIVEVGVAASSGASAYPVVARLDEPSAEVLPGMAAELRFTFANPDGHEVVVVPPTAVGEDISGRYVLLVRDVEANVGRVVRVAVHVGDLTRDGLEILSGIADGDLVVTAGVDRLVDGESVRLWADASGGV